MPRDHKYWTYIVASEGGTLYIGMTNKSGTQGSGAQGKSVRRIYQIDCWNSDTVQPFLTRTPQGERVEPLDGIRSAWILR